MRALPASCAGPRAVAGYVRALVQRPCAPCRGPQPGRRAGGCWALLAAAVVVTASGWAVYQGLGPDALEELHEAAANFMLGLVGVHVAAVLLHRLWGGHDLLRPMFSGRAAVLPRAGRAQRPPWRGRADAGGGAGLLGLAVADGAGRAAECGRPARTGA